MIEFKKSNWFTDLIFYSWCILTSDIALYIYKTIIAGIILYGTYYLITN